MRKIVYLAAAAALGASGAFAATGGHFAGSNLLPQTKVSLAQARATALANIPDALFLFTGALVTVVRGIVIGEAAILRN